MKNILISIVLGSLAPALAAQACSTLTVDGTGAGGTTLTFTLTGTPAGSFNVLFIGQAAGSTTLTFGPLGTLELGLDRPFAPLLMAPRPGPSIPPTPGNRPGQGGPPSGGNTLSIQVPQHLPLFSLYAQGTGVTIDLPGNSYPTLSFCTSDVVPFSIGG